MQYLPIISMLLFICSLNVQAQNEDNTRSETARYRNFPTDWWKEYSKRDHSWFATEEAVNIGDNIISWQTDEGGWPLMNTTNEPWTGDESAIGPWGRNGTFIYATTNEIRFLSRVYNATLDDKFRESAIAGIRYIFEAQTPTGGWPKSYPVHGEAYYRHITFNDGATVNVLTLLEELFTGQDYKYLGDSLKDQIKESYELGIACILNCQIVTNSKLTAWCQQHDEVNYRPRPGRTFEPAAISGSESVGITEFLMQIDHPSPKIKKAIECAANWFNESKIEGYKLVTVPDTTFKLRNIDRKLVPDPGSVIWARYYEIESGRPIFVGRDGIIRYNLAEIDQERRTGYAWFGQWAKGLNEQYAEWASNWDVDISDPSDSEKPEDGFFITSDSIRIHYITKGKGSPVILIHGLSATAFGNWYRNGVADSLAKNHFVVALDCRNHGLSDNPAGTLAWGSEKDVMELMDHLKIQKAHFHGYSMGGAIIGQLMAQVPERIITASMGGYGIPETDSVWIARIPEESKGSDPQAREAYQKLLIAYAMSLGMNEEEAMEFSTTPRPPRPRILPPPLDIDLTKIEFPVMVILGEYDGAQAKSHRMHREIKDFKRIILPGKSHNTAIMAGYMPRLYIDSLTRFINDNDP